MIVLTGATGQLGSQIVHQLLKRVPTDRVGISVRDTSRAADLAALGVRVRRGDYTDPGSLADAFEGATQVLIVSTDQNGSAAVAQHSAAIDAALAAGARRIVYTSHQAASAESLFAPMRDHAATERYLAQAGTPFTALRNGFYARSIPFLIGRATDSGELVAPTDGPVSWTTVADLAEAAAIILADEGRFDGATLPLTAPDALDLAHVAGLLTELTGRTIRRIVADDKEWTAGLAGHGVPAHQASMMLAIFQAVRRGEFAATGPTLETLLGRAPTAVRAVLEGVTTPR